MSLFNSSEIWQSIAKIKTSIDDINTRFNSTNDDINKIDKQHQIYDLKLSNDSKSIVTLEGNLNTLKQELDMLEESIKDMFNHFNNSLKEIDTNFDNTQRLIKSQNNRINIIESKISKIKEML